ncbi:MAG: hypothetical protein E5V49_14065 [Mesorhizobium sp.]|nr:hypothetical protein EN848_29285 [bacterium M00.F.Ca.ET.205.01.1.1]TGU50636.1 hypothetical protein EN795_23850 [bacterium M00.F.Ca.ET.152.01.1.1]TGV34094.1 hypothetical protein EN829_021805 [Mesorhizobium sp. M00.F.Ca.ET.186.01.1.1]TGZ41000.1 hypothetical protein EN805_23245 [bacterium M00.F.Ca.ET.162.01.1.1]TJW32034.1 MAG: hypothetical protein E5V49_14065 [Mesorhizobium sp.]
MIGAAGSPQEAMILGMATAGFLAGVAAGLLRWLRTGPVWTDLLVPASFLVAYWLVYNKVPSFPPIGAVNKIFFVAVTGTALGFLADATGRGGLARALVLAQPIACAAYIGAARLPDALPEVVLAALWGLLAMYGFSGATGQAEHESGTRRAALLGIACAGFAPIALLGASSSSFQLSLLFAAAMVAIVAANISNPDFGFRSASLLGGMGGMIAVAQTVTLITRKTDMLALAVLSLVFVASFVADPVFRWIGLKNKAVRIAAFAGMCLLPVGASLATVIARYGSSFPV